jgi:DNA-nicking Smr family endonuclease
MSPTRTSHPRHRALSEDERQLWETVVKDAKPLKKKPAKPAKISKAAGPSTIAKPAVSAKGAGAGKTPAAKSAAPPASASIKPVPKPAVLDRRTRSRIARGHHTIDARIDLHGMTQAEAHRALVAFIRRAQRDGATLVLVITGKGRSGEGERGVLRRQVPHWLASPELHALVIGFEAAHIGHGGEGALYVRVRRARA